MKLSPQWFREYQMSDDEFVEHVRKQDHTHCKLFWLWLLAAFLFFCFLYKFFDLFRSYVGTLPTEKQFASNGFLIGGMFGMFFFLTCANVGVAIKNWLDCKFGYRKERLLLKYYDEAKQTKNF